LNSDSVGRIARIDKTGGVVAVLVDVLASPTALVADGAALYFAKPARRVWHPKKGLPDGEVGEWKDVPGGFFRIGTGTRPPRSRAVTSGRASRRRLRTSRGAKGRRSYASTRRARSSNALNCRSFFRRSASRARRPLRWRRTA
jgi:hypothetical protein